MLEKRQLSELSRQELYELVWSMPATKIGAEFEISDVAVHKHCICKKVPRPTRGYWAKIAVGIKPRRKPLPPTPDEAFEQQAQHRIAKTLPLPSGNVPLHPLATELMQALNKTKLDYRKRIHLQAPNLPGVTISSKALVERVALAFHVILNGLEPLGILYQKFHGSHEVGFFRRGKDRLYFYIDEILYDKSGSERRFDWWQWDQGGTPTGHLAFTFKVHRYRNEETPQWTETAKVKLERILPQVISGIRTHFLNLQKQHIQEAIESKRRMEENEKRWHEYEAAEAIRLQKEKEQMHVNAIKSVEAARNLDLRKAAEWWRFHRSVTDFIDECEKRWRLTAGELTPEQTGWLAWARAIARTLDPFSAGYPDPSKHGAFDPSAISFGGPYPTAQNFPDPPTLLMGKPH